MGNREQMQELEDKIAQGLEEAYRKMVEFKKYKKTPMIVSRNGQIVAIPSEKIPPTVVYER